MDYRAVISTDKALKSSTNLDLALCRIAVDIDTAFEALLPVPDGGKGQLLAAMRYAAIGGGKRLRPLLLQASANLFGVSSAYALRAGLAAEALHVNSLIYDDLPCMDDDDLRRGKPTVHRAFGEATAVLAGNALLALSFQILADEATHPGAAVRATLIAELARCAGAEGMAGGQILDLLPRGETGDKTQVEHVQHLKTGALICWCVDAGAILGSASTEQRSALRRYAEALGLAFQIADDVLDAEGSERAVGKRLGKDHRQGKTTFVSLYGIAGARDLSLDLVDQAHRHLADYGEEADLLRAIADFAVTRTY